MLDYEVSRDTLAILPIDKNTTKVIELDCEIIVKESAFDIINKSCMYFGSSYQGRFKGTKSLIGVSHKAPIIIEETKGLIFFPTVSPRLEDCSWICLNNIKNSEKCNEISKIIFDTGYELDVDISHRSLKNQILRATHLESVLRKRKENI